MGGKTCIDLYHESYEYIVDGRTRNSSFHFERGSAPKKCFGTIFASPLIEELYLQEKKIKA